MKKADIYKSEGSKINSRMKSDNQGRSGTHDGDAPDRREQRKLDQAAGLVPFAVKLNIDLVKEIQALAQSRHVGVNELVAELLKKALAG